MNSEGADCSRSGVVVFAAAYLKDSALCWYRAHLQEVQMQHKADFANWAEFKQAFIARFTPIDPEVDARERLSRITQSKSVMAYAADFNALMLELPHMDENDRIWRFVNGLRPQVRMQVKLHSPRTLHDAIEIAIKADAVIWEPKRPIRFGGDSYKTATATCFPAPLPDLCPWSLAWSGKQLCRKVMHLGGQDRFVSSVAKQGTSRRNAPRGRLGWHVVPWVLRTQTGGGAQ